MTPAIMVQGTASGVGKSWLATALCRLYTRRGLRVVPFKAQNMSNNAAPALLGTDRGTPTWGEIGRAQAVQAEACRRVPHVDMNPLLLKPTSERGAQVVVGGVPVGHLTAKEYRARRPEWWAAVTAAYARISATADLVVIEGAGSPAEINLRAGDLVNMAMAHHADARVLLVGDIDRGGVFASLHGTVQLLDTADRVRLAGLVVNRFRGDPDILRPGLLPLEHLTGVPVRGVVPMRSDLPVDEEDALDLGGSGGAAGHAAGHAAAHAATHGRVDICVLRLPTVSNFTDLGTLAHTSGVGVRWAATPEEVGNPDLLVLPGSKHTSGDLAWLRARGLDRSVHAAAARAIPVLGLCGGYQMLGRFLVEDGVEHAALGLLPVVTRMATDKTVRPTRGETCGGWILPGGLPVEGYEIHHGVTIATGAPLVSGPDGADGAIVGLVAGTYLHGFFDRPEVRAALVAALRARKGLPASSPDATRSRDAVYDALADHVERHLDLEGLLP
ncbi:MAG: cobyric acid synthase [Pseudomonadota bacterium]|nr:cobyric acid synthase [Pseudomonadota bacterium]